jgi:enoyl-CoA hydratase
MVRGGVRLEQRDRVALVTLDRPERRNALDHAAILRLMEIQKDLAARAPTDVRVVVLTGVPPAFSAGADLHGVEQGRFATDLAAMLRGFGTLPVPVIAAIDGPALGAGAQLAIAADLRIAAPESPIGVPAARLGLVVDQWTVARLASEFTPPVARAMLLAAETYTGERLYGLGGVHRLGTIDDALAWADDLSRLAPLTIAGHKLALERREPSRDLDELVEAARRRAWESADAAEGQAAFLAKRRPDFTGA